MQTKIETLMQKGVLIPNPQSVTIEDNINIDRIASGVIIYPGCRISGSSTLILKDARIGYEAPVTIENCYIGTKADLKGGYFRQAVFLKKAVAGLGAHVREGTIIEEEASIAHTVGLKQTILFPFVTLGSLINFCDCLMSGGTSRKDHSEVGSSYIHFNYTPNQDKATPSLLGDVPRGVMLNQRPIFLGGQGGLVGPCRLEFGTVTAAGSIVRKDEEKQNMLIIEGGARPRITMPFIAGGYQNVKRILKNNAIYIANLYALMQWYIHVRSEFISDDFPDSLLEGLKNNLESSITTRISQLKIFAENMAKMHPDKAGLYEKWTEIEKSFIDAKHRQGNISLRDKFLEFIHLKIKNLGKDYIAVIKGLENTEADIGTQWLQSIVDIVTEDIDLRFKI